MNVGIFTFSRAVNYGAVLQAYALRKTLEKLGHRAEVSGWTPARIRNGGRTIPLPPVSRHPSLLFRDLKSWASDLPGQIRHLALRRKRATAFADFREKRLGLSSRAHGRPAQGNSWDAVVIGSDQVWNIGLTAGMDPFYWGFAFPPEVRVVGYAVSTGGSLRHVSASGRCRKALARFHAVSVRERELADALGKDYPVVLDPVFLLSPEEWTRLERRPKWIDDKPFLFLYRVADSDAAGRTARKWASEKGFQLVELCIGERYPSREGEAYGIPPEEFVWLAHHADAVVAASFHGTAFALLFGRPFLSFGTGSANDGRIRELLSAAGLDDCFRITDCREFPDGGHAGNISTEDSLRFLKEALEP